MAVKCDEEDLEVEHLIVQTAKRVDDALKRLLETKSGQGTDLHAAMLESVGGPAKRVRASLVFLACIELGGDPEKSLRPACAIELVHAASLILDDMPAMDNATLRRGRKATHLEYDEATAMLASVGLLNLAYNTVANDELLSPSQKTSVISAISRCVGLSGLILGQYLDLNAHRTAVSPEQIQTIHSLKTGVLFGLAAEVGALISDSGQAENLRTFGTDIGVAFQTYDDLLDIEGSEHVALKTVRHDGKKPTLVAHLGSEQAKSKADAKLRAALQALSIEMARTNLLRGYACYLQSILLEKINCRSV